MGSYGPDRLFHCASCGRLGRCDGEVDLRDGEVELWDVDGLGPTCNECLDPFSRAVFMRWLKRTLFKEISELIEEFAWGE